MKSNIVIVDYRVGNTNSVYNAVKGLGYDVKISRDENDIDNADALIMPGVGAFEEAINNINNLGLRTILEKNVIKSAKPVLGICIGMQLMASYSEENGIHQGLGWIPGEIKKIIPKDTSLNVPHVGWNEVIVKEARKVFFSNAVFESPNFYWDHSYFFSCEERFKLASVQYGDEITAIVRKDNIFGVQFHPEKSQTNGLRLFRSFFNYHKLS